MESLVMNVKLKLLRIISLSLLVNLSIYSDLVKGSGSNDYKKCCNNEEILSFRDGLYHCQYGPDYAPEFIQRRSDKKNTDELIAGDLFPVCKQPGNLNKISLSDVSDRDYSLLSYNNFCADILFDFNEFENLNNNKLAADLSPTLLYCANLINSNKSTNIVGHEESLSIPKVLKIRRCCVKGETYNIEKRACLKIDDAEDREGFSTSSLVQNVDDYDFIHAIRGPPKCEHVIVDYEVNINDVSYVAGRLQVTASSGAYDVVDLLATEESSCVDVGGENGLIVVRACRGAEYCDDHSCVRKCCPETQALFNNTCVKLSSNLTISRWHEEIQQSGSFVKNDTYEIMNTTDYGVIVGKPCRNGMYPVYREEGWHIVPEGKIHVDNYKTYEHHEYCTEMFYNYGNIPDDFYAFICFDDPPPLQANPKTRLAVNASLLSVSCAFLLVTLFVYICLPSLQNLHGKTLMCHVASLFVAFGCLVLVAIATPKEDQIDYDQVTILDSSTLCKFLGYTMLFSFLSAFFWLNVMCFDIWWKFGSLRNSGRTTTKRRDDFKRFLSYCFYAWGFALIIAITALIADYIKFLPDYLKPRIGVERCWFASDKGEYGEILFFTGPVSIQLLVNLIFFIMTARRCSMVKAEIQRRVMIDRSSDSRSRRFEADKTKLILNVKLFVVMGISWLLEIISYFLNNYANDLKWKVEFFYVSDFVNCLQGFLIFVLFVLKKKVFNALKKRFSKRNKRLNSNGGNIHDPYRVRKSPSSSTILSTFAVSSSP